MNPGATLDHYRIDSVVARGAMSGMFRATDVKTNSQVALKILDSEKESDVVYFDRFIREQEICRKLEHPNVVRTLDTSQCSPLYIVFEWVEGVSLRKILDREGKLTPERALKFARNILEILDYVHGQRVVHRDLKPENVMIVDDQDRLKLIDFGIAAFDGARRLTFGSFSRIMGTPDYISPEQMKGKRGDARIDVYALGVILYEMLTGKVPFHGEDPVAVMNDRLLHNFTPPRELDPSITPQLQEIIYRALERDPRQRYPGAKQFAWDLENPEQVAVIDRSQPQVHAHYKGGDNPWWSKASRLLHVITSL